MIVDSTIKAHYGTAHIRLQSVKEANHAIVISITDSDDCAVISLNSHELLELKRVIDHIADVRKMVES